MLYYSDVFICLILVICYSLIMAFLSSTMQRASEFGNYKNEKRTVMLQFGFFLFGFSMNLIIETMILVGDYEGWRRYYLNILSTIKHYVVDFLPIFYMTWCHH